jgi:hypothetical protein
MKRSFKIFFVIGMLIIISVVAVWYFYPKPIVYGESFEEGFGNWEADADVLPDLNNLGHSVAWNVSRVASLAHSGQYSVELYIDGRQDDGTVWIEEKIFVKNNSQIQVKVSFEFYSEHESFNDIAGMCTYAGISNPQAEANFTVIGHANEAAELKRYTYKQLCTRVQTEKCGLP